MKCVFCDFEENLTEHHLFPKCRHKRFRGKYTSAQLNETILLCRTCHNQLHDLITETDLAKSYNSIEKLKENSSVQKWISWIRKKRNH